MGDTTSEETWFMSAANPATNEICKLLLFDKSALAATGGTVIRYGMLFLVLYPHLANCIEAGDRLKVSIS